MYVETKRSFEADGVECKIDPCSLFRLQLLKDLGLHVDANLFFRFHVQHVHNRSYRLINLGFKIFSFKTIDLYISFYKTYVIPLVVYCSSIYASTSMTSINRIEQIQRYFTNCLYKRVFPGNAKVSYIERLNLFYLEPLECFLYKIYLHNMYRLLHADLSVFSIQISYSKRRPNRLCVCVRAVRSALRKSFYVHRTIMLLNRYLSYANLLSYSS